MFRISRGTMEHLFGKCSGKDVERSNTCLGSFMRISMQMMALVAFAVPVLVVEAFPRRVFRVPVYAVPARLAEVIEGKSVESLDEVNAARAARGLKPYVRCELLTAAAHLAAMHRAERRIAGHSSNDFAFLPEGSNCTVSGCGALEPSWGWGSCCTYDSYTNAGAALVVGNDGLRYMHLYVR